MSAGTNEKQIEQVHYRMIVKMYCTIKIQTKFMQEVNKKKIETNRKKESKNVINRFIG